MASKSSRSKAVRAAPSAPTGPLLPFQASDFKQAKAIHWYQHDQPSDPVFATVETLTSFVAAHSPIQPPHHVPEMFFPGQATPLGLRRWVPGPTDSVKVAKSRGPPCKLDQDNTGHKMACHKGHLPAFLYRASYIKPCTCCVDANVECVLYSWDATTRRLNACWNCFRSTKLKCSIDQYTLRAAKATDRDGSASTEDDGDELESNSRDPGAGEDLESEDGQDLANSKVDKGKGKARAEAEPSSALHKHKQSASKHATVEDASDDKAANPVDFFNMGKTRKRPISPESEGDVPTPSPAKRRRAVRKPERDPSAVRTPPSAVRTPSPPVRHGSTLASPPQASPSGSQAAGEHTAVPGADGSPVPPAPPARSPDDFGGLEEYLNGLEELSDQEPVQSSEDLLRTVNSFMEPIPTAPPLIPPPPRSGDDRSRFIRSTSVPTWGHIFCTGLPSCDLSTRPIPPGTYPHSFDHVAGQAIWTAQRTDWTFQMGSATEGFQHNLKMSLDFVKDSLVHVCNIWDQEIMRINTGFKTYVKVTKLQEKSLRDGQKAVCGLSEQRDKLLSTVRSLEDRLGSAMAERDDTRDKLRTADTRSESALAELRKDLEGQTTFAAVAEARMAQAVQDRKAAEDVAAKAEAGRQTSDRYLNQLAKRGKSSSSALEQAQAELDKSRLDLVGIREEMRVLKAANEALSAANDALGRGLLETPAKVTGASQSGPSHTTPSALPPASGLAVVPANVPSQISSDTQV